MSIITPEFYRDALLQNVLPFWLKNGLDPDHGGIFTCLDRDGSLLDTDKSVWFQGRAGWIFATLYNTVTPDPAWLKAALSCVDFSLQHCHDAAQGGKMWFTVTREGLPLRMRRYVFSESFAAISYAATAKATGRADLAEAAWAAWGVYLDYSFTPGKMPAKFTSTRPAKGIGALMIGLVTAQELRSLLGERVVMGKSCTEWIDAFVGEIERDFFKPELSVLLETVAPNGDVLDHVDGRTLNPGHALECAWFLLREGKERQMDRYVQLGLKILDCMWQRGWDREHGGLLYFTDLHGRPVQEYWHDMKFWWPHCEAIVATLMAYQITGEKRYAEWHEQVHHWSFQHFPDPEHGEWYGYLNRDGRVSQPAKGNIYKGPFHLPRMLLMAWKMLEE